LKSNHSRQGSREKQGVSNGQSNIATSSLYIFSESASKREGGYIHSRLPGLAGGSPAIVLTDGMEDETEQINGMGSGDSIVVCNFNKELEEYIDFVLGGVSNR
jgi:hypothetical protein